MAEQRTSFGLRWIVLLLLGEAALLFAIYYLRGNGGSSGLDTPASFTRVQVLNLQSLINAKGFSCPSPPALRYEQRVHGVKIVATCAQPGGETRRFEIDFSGHVRPL